MVKQQRTHEQIREHYEIEKQLADKLRNSTHQERQKLYNSVYDELFKRVSHHPQLMEKSSSQTTAMRVSREMRYLQPFLRRNTIFLEIGAGDCALSFEVAKFVKTVYAVDVSNEITQNLNAPSNFILVLSDGSSIPLPANSVTIAYSNQLMEHLHPDDALEQLSNICKVLMPGGVYICLTPNRISGPYDISRYFDHIATGLHLKEYTVRELNRLFRKTGFAKVRVYILIKRIRFFLPVFPVELCERFLWLLPYSIRRWIASSRAVSKLLGINIIGNK